MTDGTDWESTKVVNLPKMAEQNCSQFSDPPIIGSRDHISAYSGKKFVLCDRFQHVGRCGVVAKRFAYVNEKIFVAGSEYKAAAKL
jgi:hypothetical protein